MRGGTLPNVDLAVLVVYGLAVVTLGLCFAGRSRTPSSFTAARRRLSSWLVGLSLFGTYLSSNTFLGVPGKAYASNWNAFVFSLSLPVAAWVAVRYFVPFYRLGSARLEVRTSTIWVVLLYGIFINLNNFGIDQSFVQRYHTARDERAARRSVWMAAVLYVPISLLFFLIGAGLSSYYQAHPGLLTGLPSDQIFPHFIANELPPGMAGLLIAALMAAAMSSIVGILGTRFRNA